jgi:glycosyltransferase involved in cell wall biosynthesis
MNICLTCNYSTLSREYAGAQIATHNLATQLARMGHHVFAVYTTCEEIVPPPDINYEIIWARDVGRYRMRYRGLNIFPVVKAVHELASRTHLDVIQGAADEAVLLPFVARKHKCIFTMVIHRPFYPKMNSAKLLLRPDRCLLEHLCFMEWFAFTKAQRVFSVSAYTKNHVVENLGLKPEKIEVVYNGFASEFFNVRRQNMSMNGTEIVFHGRLNPQKGVDTLLKSLALVTKQLDGTKKIHLNIVGRGPWEQEYRELARSLGISQNVSFPGWMSIEQMAELFSKASLSILPTRTESFALNIGEAMAAGVPIISTNVDSVPEIITDGKTGLLVPPDNPEALAEKMLYAVTHPAEMEANARAGRTWVRENFTWEKVAEKYTLAYEELLKA